MITINPRTNAFVTYPYVYWDNWLTNTELEKIENYCQNSELIDGDIYQGSELVNTKNIRDSKINFFHPNSENQWFFEKLLHISEKINSQFYNYELYGFDFFQYTVYNSFGSKYDFHLDMLLGDSIPAGSEIPRKLSFILFLSDPAEYQGGDFEIKINDVHDDIVKPEQIKGRIIAFPSFMLHRVTPVTAGIRKSIVFWAVGPKFK
jgi:PKHD-type hydroxylase